VDDLQAALNLEADVEEIRRESQEPGWEIEGPEGLVIFVTLSSTVDDEAYCIRFECSGYPEEPFSVKPVDAKTRDSAVVSAWPLCEGFRPTSDLCLPLCREGYALHPDWQNDPRWKWNSHGNPLKRVLEELQSLINNPNKYKGRAA
jgi:hypothetical protein